MAMQYNAGILLLDTRLNVRSWDDWLSSVTGIPAGQVVGRPLHESFPDMADRGMVARMQRVVNESAVEVLAPALHHYFIRCAPQQPSPYFDVMQQHVTISPLHDEQQVVGVLITIEDVTERIERERSAGPSGIAETFSEGTQPGDRQSTDILANALDDQSWQVRRAAAVGLGGAPSTNVLARLIGMIRQEYRNVNVLNSALQALALLQADAVGPLGALLDHPDHEVRMYATQALGSVTGLARNSGAEAFLLRALHDSDVNVRYHAIEGLGKLRAAQAVAPLTEIALQRDFFLAFPALDALASIGDSRIASRLVPLLADPLLRRSTVDALGRLGDDRAVAPLVALLNSADAPADAVVEALVAIRDRYARYYGEGDYIAELIHDALEPIGVAHILAALTAARPEDLAGLIAVLGWLDSPETDRALVRLLGHTEIRDEVVRSLVRHGPRVTSLLTEQLTAEEPEVREAAAIAIGHLGDPRAVPALTRALSAEPRLAVVAAGALARIGDPAPFDDLLGMLGHPNAAVRQAGISALNSLGRSDMPDRIAPLLASPDPLVRESAIKVAGYFGYAECAAPLLELCRDPNENVRRAAVEHLPYFDAPAAVTELAKALAEDVPRVRVAAARAMAHISPEAALPWLLAALDDSDPWVRYAAARSLGAHRAQEALEPLEALAHEDPAGQVRIAAVEALGQLGSARAVSSLMPLATARDLDVARAALRALARVPHADALVPLLAALQAGEPERRAEAAGGLGLRRQDVHASVAALQWLAATDSHHSVIAAAIGALGNLASAEAVAALIALTADPARRELSIAALARLGPASAGQIAQGLAYPQGAVRRAVIDALAQMKHPVASEVISAALDHDDPSVRLAACAALGRLGSPFAEERLAAMARSDPDSAVRQAAEEALRS